MRHLVIALMLMLWPAVLLAQNTPRIEVTLDATEVTPGQPVVLRIKVLVPTWMPTPPVYPTLEQPNLMVRLPERATTPVSEKIEGETWSGTSRAYRLYPLTPGDFTIADSVLTVTYAAPGSSDPVTVDLPIDPITFAAIVPEAAKDLSPLIAATGFKVEQSFDGLPEGEMQVGDVITRTLTAQIDGTTPIMIPDLLPRPEDGPLRAYADEPRVSESENRGVLSGARTERVSYVAQGQGQVTLPDISIKWYDLETKSVETISLAGETITVSPPPAPPINPVDTLLRVLMVLAICLVGYLGWRKIRPKLQAWRIARRAAYVASEPHAARQVDTALKDQDLGAVFNAFDHWIGFYPNAMKWPEAAMFLATLQPIGAQKFDRSPVSDANWDNVVSAFSTLKTAARQHRKTTTGLPDLNPVRAA